MAAPPSLLPYSVRALLPPFPPSLSSFWLFVSVSFLRHLTAPIYYLSPQQPPAPPPPTLAYFCPNR